MTQRYIGKPAIEVRAEQPYIGIAIQAALDEWNKVGVLSQEIFEWLERNEVEAVGAIFHRHWLVDDETEKWHMEVGIPVERMVLGEERIIAGFIPGGAYVTALHNGHPDHLAKSYNELEIWAKKEGLELDKRWEGDDEIWNGRFECYLTDPDIEPDPAKWKIRLSLLLKPDDAA